jgi:hypothetical protein
MVFDNVFHIGYLLNSNNVSTVYQLCHSILVVSKLSYPCMKGAESFRKSEFQLSLLCPRDCPFLVLVDLWIASTLYISSLSFLIAWTHLLNNPFCNDLSHNLSLSTLIHIQLSIQRSTSTKKGQSLGHKSESWNSDFRKLSAPFIQG